VINLDFDNGMAMSWEGRSCNGKTIEGSSVGVMFYGEKGSILIPGGDSYTVFDLADKVVKHVEAGQQIDPRNIADPAEQLDAFHIRNMFDAIKSGAKLRSDIDSGHKSTLLVQLGNISQRVGRSLNTDPKSGHIIKDEEAQTYWSRTYEKGWEMKL
jgi:predicted dehydrogenase